MQNNFAEFCEYFANNFKCLLLSKYMKNAWQETIIEEIKVNKTIKVKICKSFFSKFLGKMFSFSKKPLLFVFSKEQKVSIHMLFVFMPLTVIWLDKNKRIVKIKKMKPFVSFGAERAMYVLEIPLSSKKK